MITALRYHDISCGHRVVGHESKCRHLHGHNYRVTFEVMATSLDSVGRVLDFSVIKARLCEWLEQNWDHKMLIWEKDPMVEKLLMLDPSGVCVVPFNPTAENMAEYLVKGVGPSELFDLPVNLISVQIDETRKCSVRYTLPMEGLCQIK